MGGYLNAFVFLDGRLIKPLVESRGKIPLGDQELGPRNVGYKTNLWTL